MSAAIGPGALLLPYMFRLVGVPLGILCLSFGAYTAAQSLRFIISLVYLTGADSYPASVAAVLGPAAGAGLSHVTTFVLILGTGGHLKCLADVLRRLLPPALEEDAPVTLLAVALVFPLAVRRDISFLRHAAVVAPLGLLYNLVLILSRGLGSSPAASGDTSQAQEAVAMEALRFGDGGLAQLPRAWTLVLNAMTCHHLAVPVYKELHCAKAQRVNKVVLRSITSITLLYALVGACGFLTHGTTTPENILLVYPRGDGAASLAKVLVGCALLVSLPLNVHALRGHLIETLPGHFAKALLRGASAPGRVASTALLVGVPAGICCAFPSVTAIVGVGVGFGIVAYMFVLPAAALCALRWGGTTQRKVPGSFSGSACSDGPDYQDLLLSSPLSTPFLSPRLGCMVSPVPSQPDVAGMDDTNAGLGEPFEADLPPLELPTTGASALEEEGASPVFQMQTLPVASGIGKEADCDCESPMQRGRAANRASSFSDGARSPSPSPSDDGLPGISTRWSLEFPIALAAMSVGSVLGMTAACKTLVGLLLGA